MASSLESIYNDLTDEQKQRVQSLKTPEELFAFARDEGIELNDLELEGIAGGRKLCWGNLDT